MTRPRATAVGSLPHHDPVVAAELVVRALPDLPAAPQLPNRSRRELMLAQAADGVRGVSVTEDGALAVDDDELGVGDVESFADDCWDSLLTFLRLTKDRQGPVKVQLAGPVTLAVALERGGAHVGKATQVAAEAVRRRAAALLKLVADNDERVLCLDEPWLAGAHPAIPVEDVVAGVIEALDPPTMGGVHCCGLADWDALLARVPAETVASIPLPSARPASIAQFLTNGGIVAWGAVPTQPPYVTDVDELWDRLRPVLRAVVAEGCPEDVVRSRSWVTPECGLAGLSESAAEDALAGARGLADRLPDGDL